MNTAVIKCAICGKDGVSAALGICWDCRLKNDIRTQLQGIPQAPDYSANRYDTDNEIVLHVWRGQDGYDIRVPKSDAKRDVCDFIDASGCCQHPVNGVGHHFTCGCPSHKNDNEGEQNCHHCYWENAGECKRSTDNDDDPCNGFYWTPKILFRNVIKPSQPKSETIYMPYSFYSTQGYEAVIEALHKMGYSVAKTYPKEG